MLKIDLTNETIIHVKKDGVEYIQFRRLLDFKDLVHAYAIKPKNFRTSDTTLEKKDYKKAIENYKDLCRELKLDINKLVKPNQNHTKNVESVFEIRESDIAQTHKKTDGLITDIKDNVLVTTNADCILLLLYDFKKRVIGNIHSGWRGTVDEIAKVSINKMIKDYNCKPENIICCICPSIRSCHFEVEKDVKEIFQKQFCDMENIGEIIKYKGTNIQKNGEKVDKWLIDTVLINKTILKQCGLIEENIIDSGICSVCFSDNIHSCRVEGKDSFGLNTAIISLK